MKKLIIAALFTFSLSCFAQKKQNSDIIIEKMTTELSLTTEQQANLKPVFEEQMALRKDNKLNPANVETNKVKFKEINKKIKSILTTEQWQLQKDKMLQSKHSREVRKYKMSNIPLK